MQTFLPYPDFEASLRVLDYRRLGKQRLEALQLIRAISGETVGWSRHPAAVMWRGYLNALKQYHNIAIEEWIRRGYRNNMPKKRIRGKIVYPPWLGNEAFHASHRSNLLRKDREHYGAFGWTEPDNLPYLWPG
ncbi:MAG TPA: MSMEG_6728 family protein [Smithellaceae bacterium]|nr:MSMEG_6728 family protein [Smithellaceae bacterium]